MIESRYPHPCTQVILLRFLLKTLQFSSIQVIWVFQFTKITKSFSSKNAWKCLVVYLPSNKLQHQMKSCFPKSKIKTVQSWLWIEYYWSIMSWERSEWPQFPWIRWKGFGSWPQNHQTVFVGWSCTWICNDWAWIGFLIICLSIISINIFCLSGTTLA